MTQAETVAMFETFRTTFGDAAVSVAIAYDPNTTITANGLRSNKTLSRAIQRNATTTTADMGIWVRVDAFTAEQAAHLSGKAVTITRGADVVSQRIMQTREHALGGLMLLSLGDFDRVTM